MKPSPEEFIKNRSPRRGDSNPQDMTNPFWVWCVQNGGSAYVNNEEFGEDCSLDIGPCWSFDRLGISKSTLPDGRIVYIAGEHEDWYDPDFYIYNDVIVVALDGKITIYGYPEEIFPPTDFHTASLVDDELILIGALSYRKQREEGLTQVLRLNLNDWSIKQQHTRNMPGWISGHQIIPQPNPRKIRISGFQRWTEKHDLFDDFSTWELDLDSWQWHCLEKKNWKQFQLSRRDGKSNNLFDIRHSIEMKDLGLATTDLSSFLDDYPDEESASLARVTFEDMRKEQDELIAKTNLDLLPGLYRPSVSHTEILKPEPTLEELDDNSGDRDYNHYRIAVDGVEICFIENSAEITMRVEGEIPDEKMETIATDICRNLSELEGSEYYYQELPSL